MNQKTYDNTAYNRRSMEKLGKKPKSFTLDAETLTLFDALAEKTGLSHVQILRDALRLYAKKQGT